MFCVGVSTIGTNVAVVIPPADLERITKPKWTISRSEHVLRKIHHCTFGRKISERPFFRNFIPIFCTIYTPYIHTHMLFSRFCTLLCVLVTVHIAHTIYFVLIHHCINSLSSLHIFFHHCTFCASLHTKTSPAAGISTLQCYIIKLFCLSYFMC